MKMLFHLSLFWIIIAFCLCSYMCITYLVYLYRTKQLLFLYSDIYLFDKATAWSFFVRYKRVHFADRSPYENTSIIGWNNLFRMLYHSTLDFASLLIRIKFINVIFIFSVENFVFEMKRTQRSMYIFCSFSFYNSCHMRKDEIYLIFLF